MRHAYDIFEKFPDGSYKWRACVDGTCDARRNLQELAENSVNEFFAIDIVAGERLPFIMPRSADSHERTQRAVKQIA